MLITEGLTKLEIPKNYLKKKHFFNPKVELSRDLTILFLRTLNSKNWMVCDVLAGTGARGIRIAKECPVKKVWLNDIREDNVPFMKKNTKLNSLTRKVKITNQDANLLLSSQIRNFNYIDIDPWGSPCYYFDSAARAVKRKGFIGFSATDTAALSGTSPVTCLRRYGIESLKTDFFKELGVRILITNAALSFSKWSFSFKPLLSFTSQHYFRVFAEVKKGRNIASKCVKDNLGYVSYCQKCLWREVGKVPVVKCKFCGSESEIIGKVWVGKIEDIEFIDDLEKELIQVNWLKTGKKIRRLLFLLKNEYLPFYYDVHKLCQKNMLKIPKFTVLEDKLKDRGCKADRTHFSDKGIKTDAPLKVLINAVKYV
jgi:tRNA (guanine26-N2/guanine27-N2)-dimethyltransferase